MSAVALVEPSRAWLAEFAAALARGWSPHTERDVSAEQLAELRADPEAFLAELVRPRRRLRLPDGTLVQRLPGFVRWIVDGAFCGTINFRYAPGTEALPSYCSGHIGYAVVPWQRRRGVATAEMASRAEEDSALGHSWELGVDLHHLVCKPCAVNREPNIAVRFDLVALQSIWIRVADGAPSRWPLRGVHHDVVTRNANEIRDGEVQHGDGIVNGHLLPLAPRCRSIE